MLLAEAKEIRGRGAAYVQALREVTPEDYTAAQMMGALGYALELILRAMEEHSADLGGGIRGWLDLLRSRFPDA